MTCTEFRELTDRNPIDCTRAERVACYRHHEDCKDCQDFIENRDRAELDELEANDPVGNLLTDIAVDWLVRSDMADPESQKTVEKTVDEPRRFS